MLLQIAEELEASQLDSRAGVPFESATSAAAHHSGVLDKESELAMWQATRAQSPNLMLAILQFTLRMDRIQVQSLINAASNALEPTDVSPSLVLEAVELSRLGLRCEQQGDTATACAHFHEAALKLPTLPSLLSSALMRLKNKQPLLALPLYTFVLQHAEEGCKELEIARARLDDVATNVRAACESHHLYTRAA